MDDAGPREPDQLDVVDLGTIVDEMRQEQAAYEDAIQADERTPVQAVHDARKLLQRVLDLAESSEARLGDLAPVLDEIAEAVEVPHVHVDGPVGPLQAALDTLDEEDRAVLLSALLGIARLRLRGQSNGVYVSDMTDVILRILTDLQSSLLASSAD